MLQNKIDLTKNNVTMKCNFLTNYSLRYLEFPELLFVSDSKNRLYFDATLYVEQKGDITKHSPIDFVKSHTSWIKAICNSYNIDEETIIMTNTSTKHILIDESLSLLFVAYIDPEFGVHILERMSEMLLNGLVLSDTYISKITGDRFNLTT